MGRALPLEERIQTQVSPDRATVQDRLGFDLYVRGIVRTIQTAIQRNHLPLTIGVYGRWGSGKTSLMLMVEAGLKAARSSASASSPESASQPAAAAGAKRARTRARLARALTVAYPVLFAALCFRYTALVNAIATLTTWHRDAVGFAWVTGGCFVLGAWMRTVWDGWIESQEVESAPAPAHAWLLLRVPAAFLLAAASFGWLTPIRTAVRSPGAAMWLTGSAAVVALVAGIAIDHAVRALWRRIAPPHGPALAPEAAEVQVIWFNAWRFAAEKELWAALLQQILTEVRIRARGAARLKIRWALWRRSILWQAGAADIARRLAPTVGRAGLLAAFGAGMYWLTRRLIGTTATDAERTAAGTLVGLVVSLAPVAAWLREQVAKPLADLDLAKYRRRESYKNQLGFLSEFSEEMRAITEIARGARAPIVLMLDDVDRCLPEQAVSVLEAIKLFVSEDAPIVFVLGADREFIERAITVKYEKFTSVSDESPAQHERFSRLGSEYLEKIVQLPFNLPPIEVDRIDKFIDERFADDPRVCDLSNVFAAGLERNPRQVLRAVDAFRFVAGLVEINGDFYSGRIRADLLAKLVVIQYRWPELYAELVQTPTLLDAIERAVRKQPESSIDPVASPTPLMERARFYAANAPLVQLLTVQSASTFLDVPLAPYIFVTARAHAQAPANAAPASQVAPASSGPESNAAVPPPGQSATPSIAPPGGRFPPRAEPASPPPTTPPAVQEAVPPVPRPGEAAAPTHAAPGVPLASSQPAAPAAPPTAEPDLAATYAIMRQEFDSLFAQLKSGGGDSALLARLGDVRERVNGLAASNAKADAARLIEEFLPAARRARDAQMAPPPGGPEIRIQTSKSGAILFETAITYRPAQLLIQPTQDLPGELRADFVDRGRPLRSWPLRMSASPLPSWLIPVLGGFHPSEAAEQVEKAYEVAARTLGESHLKLLADLPDPQTPRRIEVTCEPEAAEAIPWELARPSPEPEPPLGLDPRLSLVRTQRRVSVPITPTMKSWPLGILLTGFGSSSAAHEDATRRLGLLSEAFSGVQKSGAATVSVLIDPTVIDLQEALKQMPGIVHVVIGGSETRESLMIRRGQGGRSTLGAQELGGWLRGIPYSVVVAGASTRPLARDLGEFVTAAVGWQFEMSPEAETAFARSYYAALLRTGQPDFAITEARRAIRATSGVAWFEALSPVLHLAPNDPIPAP